ncbi:sugar phosphate nucleotidyltransferase [Saccharothrix algeriensis]|uniref:Mannose-1-phosphate guanylyltransferase n=1 Tax=Saccharothrix algeriensis TaxID=173560 RepID=A0A8T8HT98_9PSEU|nr:NDP-sugar synthase [Saccharothrix algeriensis]MBM7812958.1 mannose-1-phosphate guanylyltransferase [Saccharothrix algeriensis]QTR01591.1 NDP-sugar synthase [Saccharothrix algeriensis]
MSELQGAEAVVLVGGKGTRLRPLTLSAPKPMLPTAGVPFLTHLLSRIREVGITHVVLGTSYKAEVFQEHFGDGSALGLDLEYVVEDVPLDTAGAIRNVAHKLRERDVMVFNGDILSGVDLRGVLDTHRSSAADVTLHLVKVEDPRRFGCVPTDDEGRVTAFLEKTENPPTDQINAGCYVFRREVVDAIPAGRPVSVERETFPGLLAAGARLQGHVDTSYWLDLGTPAAFVRGSADLVLGVAPSAALPAPTGDAIVLPGAQVDPAAVVTGGATVGAGCTVAAGAVVDGSVLFDGAVVGEGARVERSVVGADALVQAGAVVSDSVIGDQAVIGARCELIGGARVWPGVALPEAGVRFSTDA